MMRRLAVAVQSAILLSVVAAVPVEAAVPAGPGVQSDGRAGAFDEWYRGRHIQGWGGGQPCAFVDGVSLELIAHGGNRYSSAVTAYETTFGVRATTRAAVRSLAGAGLQPAEPPAYCRS